MPFTIEITDADLDLFFRTYSRASAPRRGRGWKSRRDYQGVYLVMCCGWQPGMPDKTYPIKIGLSHDVHTRISEMQTGNPYPLLCVGESKIYCSQAKQLETALHDHFRDQRIGQKHEWFNLTKAQVEWIKKKPFKHRYLKDALGEISDELQKTERLSP